MPWGSVRDVTPESAPWAIAALHAMNDELFELEPETLDAQAKRVMKMSHIAVTIGRVMWVWYKQKWEEEEEEK
jgi:hypothetical protein